MPALADGHLKLTVAATQSVALTSCLGGFGPPCTCSSPALSKGQLLSGWWLGRQGKTGFGRSATARRKSMHVANVPSSPLRAARMSVTAPADLGAVRPCHDQPSDFSACPTSSVAAYTICAS